jgi:hypothetical protein
VDAVTLDADLSHPPAGVSVPSCPVCAADLQLGGTPSADGTDTFHCWTCPNGHGLAMTLTESYERLEEDEIAQIWQKARTGAPGPLPSPFHGGPMVRVNVEVDEDEVPEGRPGDGPTTATVVVDVDVENQFIWLDAGELDEFPVDLPDPEPSAEELAAERAIVERFGASYEAAVEERESDELTERLYRRVARHPGALKVLDSIGRGITAY